MRVRISNENSIVFGLTPLAASTEGIISDESINLLQFERIYVLGRYDWVTRYVDASNLVCSAGTLQYIVWLNKKPCQNDIVLPKITAGFPE